MSNSLEIQNNVYIDTNQNFDSKVFEAKLKNLFNEKQNLEELVDSLGSKLQTFLHKRLRFKTEVELFEENVQRAAVDKIELNFNSNVTKNLQTCSFEFSLIADILVDYCSGLDETEKRIFHFKLNELNTNLANKSTQESKRPDLLVQDLKYDSKCNTFLSEEDDEYFWDDEFSFLQKTTSFMPLHALSNVFNSNISSGKIINSIEETTSNDIEKQKMVEKICESQIKIAKLNDEKDILENHIHDLKINLEQKKRIIQGFAMGENKNAFTDDIKIIANDVKEVMSVELCLKVNEKLQTLLEETLLKNLSLKESLNLMALAEESTNKRIFWDLI